MKSQAKAMRSASIGAHFVLLFFTAGAFLSNVLIYDASVTMENSKGFVQILNLGGTVYAVVVLGTMICWHRMHEYKVVEAVSIISCMLAIVTIPLSSGYRMSRLYDEDPKESWQKSSFSDCRTLLYLDLVIAACHLFMPVRIYLSWAVPVVACLSYFIYIVSIGSPEVDTIGVFEGVVLSFQLAGLGTFSWFGARRAEGQSRRAFERQGQLHKGVVQERVLRFDAERELDIARGTWNPIASGNPEPCVTPAVIGTRRTGRTEAASDSVVRKTSFRYDLAPSSITLSEKVSSSDVWSLDDIPEEPIFLLASSAKLLTERPEDPGVLVAVEAGAFGAGHRVLSLDRSTGDLTLAEVVRARGEQDLKSSTSWIRLEIAFGVDFKSEGQVLINRATPVLIMEEHILRSQAASDLSLGEDRLYGIALDTACGESGSDSNDTQSTVAISQLKATTFGVVGKASSKVPDVFPIVGLELLEPSKYAPLLGVSGSSLQTVRHFVALTSFCFTQQEVQFKY